MRPSLPLLGAALSLIAAPAALASGELRYPISGPLTSNYNSPRSYGRHAALDIAGANRADVGAARGGRVSFQGWSGGYGNLTKVDHEAGYQTYYAHLSAFRGGVGANVGAGGTIGLEGTTGNSTGPHVHFEVRRWGATQFVPGNVGDRVSKGAGLPYTYPGLSGASPPSPPRPVAPSRHTGYASTAVLNVRVGPSTGHRIMGTLARGERIAAFAREGAWARVWFRGQAAYCHTGYLTSAGRRIPGNKVTTDVLNVRTGPSTGHQIVGSVRRGQVYPRLGQQGAWILIPWGGANRWCHGGYTQAGAILGP